MQTLRRAVVIAVFAASSLPAMASAAQPDSATIQIDETFVPAQLSAHCGFTVTRHVEGTLSVRVFYDAAGNFASEIDAYHESETLTAGDATLVGRTVQNIRVVAYADGSFSVAFAGADFRLPVAKSGISFGSAGRFVLTFAPDGSVDVAQDVGNVRADLDAICAALRP